MKFKYSTEINKANADVVGEYLRSCFFKYDVNGITWDPCDDVNVTSKEVNKEFEGIPIYYVAYMGVKEIDGRRVICNWYCDDDYFIAFSFDDGSSLRNHDGEKDYNWSYLA